MKAGVNCYAKIQEDGSIVTNGWYNPICCNLNDPNTNLWCVASYISHPTATRNRKVPAMSSVIGMGSHISNIDIPFWYSRGEEREEEGSNTTHRKQARN